jgi:hypothetical protein
MRFPNVSALGEPDLKIGGLQIWVQGQERARSADAYDADWLRITAHCGSDGASVVASGAILTASSFERFGHALRELSETAKESASLESYEPNLVVKVSALLAKVSARDRRGHLELAVEITPDHVSQSHRFRFDLAGVDVSDAARQCEDIVKRFPGRSVPH